jgi:hypothetical protein
MNRKALNKLRRRLEEFQSSPGNISSRKLAGLAISLGRRRVKKQTGEPMYVSDAFPKQLRPIPIPSHPRVAISKTAIKILTWLENDFFHWEEKLQQQEIQTKHIKNHEKEAKK